MDCSIRKRIALFVKKRSGFTLVELIVVVAILSILGTITFLSYSDTILNARNVTRKADMGEMKVRLRGVKQKIGSYPLPASPFTLSNSGVLAVTQGTSDSIEVENGSIRMDPKTSRSYLYATTLNRQSYQIGMTIEGDNFLQAYVDGDYTPLLPSVFPSLLLATGATGTVEVRDGFGAGSVNRVRFIVHNSYLNLPYDMQGNPVATAATFGDITAQSGVVIPTSSNYTDCQAIYEGGKSLGSWDYLVVTSTGIIVTTECLMSPPNYAMAVVPICTPGELTFNYTGGDQNFVVPVGCTNLAVKAWGASGGSKNTDPSLRGWGGGFASGALTVTPWETLTIVVGGGGSIAVNTSAYGGGGAGSWGGGNEAAWGGGRSSIMRSWNDLLVAGGWGWSNTPTGGGCAVSWGWYGGWTNGTTGWGSAGTWWGGASQVAPGAGGTAGGGAGSAGSLKVGGSGGASAWYGWGGGGGGYYGGGGWWAGTVWDCGSAGGGWSGFIPAGGIMLAASSPASAWSGDVHYPGGNVGTSLISSAGGNGYVRVFYY